MQWESLWQWLETTDKGYFHELLKKKRHKIHIFKIEMHRWSLPTSTTVMSKSEFPKELKQLQNSPSDIWALKQPMRAWGAILSNGERSQAVWWWRLQTPSTPEALGLSRVPRWGRWMRSWRQGHARRWKSCGAQGPSQEKILKNLVPT